MLCAVYITEAHPSSGSLSTAIILGLEKFRDYLYGRKFVLVTDNRVLSKIFFEEKGLPFTTAEHIQIWALRLSHFDCNVEWKRGSENKADFRSWHPAQRTSNGYKGGACGNFL